LLVHFIGQPPFHIRVPSWKTIMVAEKKSKFSSFILSKDSVQHILDLIALLHG
jgi:hypothetical protein